MRGEQEVQLIEVSPVTGSSPHAWGTGSAFGLWYRYKRFIPTCVGNRQDRYYGQENEAVHPHMRGEQANR